MLAHQAGGFRLPWAFSTSATVDQDAADPGQPCRQGRLVLHHLLQGEYARLGTNYLWYELLLSHRLYATVSRVTVSPGLSVGPRHRPQCIRGAPCWFNEVQGTITTDRLGR